MAGIVVLLSTHLTQKLSNTDEELSKRLEVARIVFTSISVPILRKEELVLQWLCELIYAPEDIGEEVTLAIKCLKSCLTSQRMKTLSGEIRPSVTDSLLMVLASVNEKKYIDSVEDLQECVVAMMESPYYQHWLSRDVGALSCVLKNYFESLSSRSNVQQVLKVLGLLSTITKQCILRQELRREFITDIFIPMTRTLAILENTKELRSKIQSSIFLILLYEQKFLSKIITAFQSKQDNYDPGVKELVTSFKKLPSCGDERNVAVCYTSFLRAVIQSSKDDHETILNAFSALCTLAGITTRSIKSVTLKPLKNWTKEQSFSVITELVRLLDESNIPLKANLGGVGLQDWFTCLLTGVVSLHVKDLSPQLLGLVRSVVEFNPLVVENGVRALATIMLQKKESEEVQSEYVLLMKSTFAAAHSIQRFQKMIARTLPLLQEIMKFSCDECITLEDIMPKEVSRAFGESTFSIPNQQLLQMMKTLLFHLENDGLDKLENEELPLDSSLKIPIQVSSEMLCQFLQANRLTKRDLPDVVKEKFNSMHTDLEDLLGKLGSSLLYRSHDNELLRHFLHLVSVNGSLKLWLWEKEGGALKETSQTDLEPTNLCYLHPYIPPDHWVLIAQRIENHNHGPTKDIYYTLLEQKMLAVGQVEVGEEGPGTQAGRYLLENASKPWLSEHVNTLAALFETKELLVLAAKLVRNHLPHSDAFFSNRRWSMAVMLVLLQRVSSHVQKNKKGGGVSYSLASRLDPARLVEAELGRLLGKTDQDEDDEEGIAELLTPLQFALSRPKTPQLSEKLSISSELEVLNSMPVNHFGARCQCFLASTIIALLYDLPPDETYDKHLFGIFTKILEGTDTKCYKDILGNLNASAVVRFLATRGVSYPLLNYLMKKLIFLCLTFRVSTLLLIKAIKSPSAKTIWITSLTMQILVKMKSKQMSSGSEEDEEDDDNEYDDDIVEPVQVRRGMDKRKVVSRLAAGCIPVLVKETPTKALLQDFTTVYKWAAFRDHKSTLTALKPVLDQYINIAVQLENFDEGWSLMDTLMKYRGTDKETIPTQLLQDVWTNLVSFPPPLPSEITESRLHLFSCLKSSELNKMLQQLRTITHEEIEQNGMRTEELDKLFWLWSEVISCSMSSEMEKVRQENLVALVPSILSLTKNATSTKPLKPLLELVSKLARTPSVELKNTVLDCCLETLWCSPRANDSALESVRHLNLILDAMFALYLFRTSLMVDRLPVLLQRYRQAMTALAAISPEMEDEEVLNAAKNCAHKIEKGAGVMVKRKKDFSRIAPYIIADILNIIVDHRMLPSIKVYLSNTIEIFLLICDQHGISFLTNNLPTASQEVFKVAYEDYKKHGRFKGKI